MAPSNEPKTNEVRPSSLPNHDVPFPLRAPALPEGLDFRLLFEASPDILLVLLPDSPRFTMVAATEARLRATLTTRQETIGKGLFELFPDNPDDPQADGVSNLRASLERVLASRDADTMAVQKYDIRNQDGTFEARYWSPKNLPVLSPGGEILYLLHRVEDVTELVRASALGDELRGRTAAMEREVVARSRELAEANRKLRQANLHLGELDAAKTVFFSDVSHELRTPLTLLLGPLEDALTDPASPLPETQRVRLEMAQSNALRLLKLVNALLDVARLEAGRLQARFAPADLPTCVAELAGMFQSAVEKAGLRFVVDCKPVSEPAWIDRDLWEKIVPNLVSNALKFTLEGEIAVRCGESGDRFFVEVRDTGIGIPPEELPRIFDRFYRAHERTGRSFEGTGIGLSLARELVLLHGGELTVRSEVGQGTTFRAAIPKGREHLPAEAVFLTAPAVPAVRPGALHVDEARRWGAKPSKAPAPAGERGARPQVLVCDDNADLRAYLGGLLSPHYDVRLTGDGEEALAAVRESLPDLVLSDVMMPRLNGYGLLRALREQPETSSLPVILLSARAGEESALEGLEAGSDDYLIKPFSARELLARVRTHLELARVRQAWIAELEKVNRELDSFSYTVSHDLRAPLRAIDGFSQILAENCADRLDPEALRYLTRIRAAVKRMEDLIAGLLSLAHVSRAELHHAPVDLAFIAHSVIDVLRAHRSDSRPPTEVVIAPGLLTAGDPRLLRVVLENLLGNAWKFTSKTGHPRIEVGTERTDDADGPVFFVRDNGAGFESALVDKLFGAFRRLHSSHEFEGHGIGLATVQRILQRHGGRIWAEGAVGKGAKFSFTVGRGGGAATR